jgi:hypothetical protein
MEKRFIGLAAAAITGTLAMGSANAMLVLQGPQDFQGTGLGAVNTVLTLQSPGSSTFESGSVSRAPGNPNDVITGNAGTGASQTQTRSIGSLGVTSASDIRVVFNAQEPGNATDNTVLLNTLQLNIYSSSGNLLFSSGGFNSVNFANTFTGAGNSGFVFALDSAQAAQAQAAAFGTGFATNLIGLSAAASNATGGPETFFVASAGGAVPAIPEPETYALMLAGLSVVGFGARRRKR